MALQRRRQSRLVLGRPITRTLPRAYTRTRGGSDSGFFVLVFARSGVLGLLATAVEFCLCTCQPVPFASVILPHRRKIANPCQQSYAMGMGKPDTKPDIDEFDELKRLSDRLRRSRRVLKQLLAETGRAIKDHRSLLNSYREQQTLVKSRIATRKTPEQKAADKRAARNAAQKKKRDAERRVFRQAEIRRLEAELAAMPPDDEG